jgi:hypothetical protein
MTKLSTIHDGQHVGHDKLPVISKLVMPKRRRRKEYDEQ